MKEEISCKDWEELPGWAQTKVVDTALGLLRFDVEWWVLDPDRICLYVDNEYTYIVDKSRERVV
ncbi:hypothetical protein [Streptomyces sp. CoH17]|uniref:hypothetical protein n=1 Tax=Streptomyces sp. CoH17 TaxID=2992806 RepID=UPI00226DD5E8|nr:hypothetical protein [Streptomyces sp. CoH17]